MLSSAKIGRSMILKNQPNNSLDPIQVHTQHKETSIMHGQEGKDKFGKKVWLDLELMNEIRINRQLYE